MELREGFRRFESSLVTDLDLFTVVLRTKATKEARVGVKRAKGVKGDSIISIVIYSNYVYRFFTCYKCYKACVFPSFKASQCAFPKVPATINGKTRVASA